MLYSRFLLSIILTFSIIINKTHAEGGQTSKRTVFYGFVEDKTCQAPEIDRALGKYHNWNLGANSFYALALETRQLILKSRELGFEWLFTESKLDRAEAAYEVCRIEEALAWVEEAHAEATASLVQARQTISPNF